MTHRAKQILDQLTVAVTGLPTTTDRVMQTRIYKKHSLPMLGVSCGAIKTSVTSGNVSDATLDVAIDIYVEGDEDSLDDQVLQIHSEIHTAVMASPGLGLDYVIDTVAVGLDEIDVQVGQKAIGTSSARFQVKFRHSTDSWEV